MADPVLFWLRQDLRLHDQPALLAAAHEGPVIPVYILDDYGPGAWKIGAAQRWWLHYTLDAFGKALHEKGSRLVLRRGKAAAELKALMKETGAARIHAIRHYEPWWRAVESEMGDAVCLHDGNHLAPIESVTTGAGTQFKVFSSFWKALSARMPPEDPLPMPRTIAAPTKWPRSDALADWKLLPTNPDWSEGFDVWAPGEEAARNAVTHFAGGVEAYEHDRNMAFDRRHVAPLAAPPFR